VSADQSSRGGPFSEKTLQPSNQAHCVGTPQRLRGRRDRGRGGKPDRTNAYVRAAGKILTPAARERHATGRTVPVDLHFGTRARIYVVQTLIRHRESITTTTPLNPSEQRNVMCRFFFFFICKKALLHMFYVVLSVRLDTRKRSTRIPLLQ